MAAWLTVLNALLVAALLPLAGFFALFFWGRRFGRDGAACGAVATATTVLSLGFSVVALVLWVAKPEINHPNYVEAFTYHWLVLPVNASAGPSGGLAFDPGAAQPAVTIGCLIDSLTIATFVMASFITLLVHIFAWQEFAGSPHKPRFFALLQLLLFSILALLLANSLIQMLIFWQLIGIAAYFLVGFRHDLLADSGKPLRAALRMFLMNVAGDAAFLTGIGILALHTRSLAGLAFFDDRGTSILSTYVRQALGVRSSEFLFFTGEGFLQMHWLTWAGICFIIAALARMAQFPFQSWAHQAAKAATFVSAMLQGLATLVVGVYLIARIYPILTVDARFILAIVGCITLVTAALVAIVQTDIRQILVWSTISQGGYMLLFLGVGGYTAGILHLFTHVFYKTSLLLAAGIVLQGLGGDARAGADVRNLGGLWKRFPITAAVSFIGVLALAGAPWLSGAYSSNLGLACVYDYARALQGQSTATNHYEMLLFWMPVLTTYLTAFGIGRWWWLIFAGQSRQPKLLETAHEAAFLTLPVIILAGFSLGVWFDFFGIIPLIAKSIPATLMGLVINKSDPAADPAYATVLRSAGWAALGLGVAALVYLDGFSISKRFRRLPGINLLDFWLRERFFFDLVYDGIFLNLLRLFSRAATAMETLLGILFKLIVALGSLLVFMVGKLETFPLARAVVAPPAPPSPVE